MGRSARLGVALLSFVPRAPEQGVSNFTELVLSHLLQDSSFSEAGSNVLRLEKTGWDARGKEEKERGASLGLGTGPVTLPGPLQFKFSSKILSPLTITSY